MRVPLPGAVVDERFLQHRLRSTSLAGIVGGLLAICLFALFLRRPYPEIGSLHRGHNERLG